jgi:hypothetical protein
MADGAAVTAWDRCETAADCSVVVEIAVAAEYFVGPEAAVAAVPRPRFRRAGVRAAAAAGTGVVDD